MISNRNLRESKQQSALTKLISRISDPIPVSGLKTTRNTRATKASKDSTVTHVTKEKPCFRIVAARTTVVHKEETEFARAKFHTSPRKDPPRLRRVLDKRAAKIRDLMDYDHTVRTGSPETELKFIDYDIHSIPILYSAHIEHQYPHEDVAKPSKQIQHDVTASKPRKFTLKMFSLRQKALSLAGKPLLTSCDLGRRQVPKSSPAVFIDDCDLYLYEDKVFVATERGLLLAADYIKLLDIPDTRPVRFKGLKPSWMKKAEAAAEHRRVLLAFLPSRDLEAEGCMELCPGSVVVVLECGIFDIGNVQGVKMAYGMRLHDGTRGWFPYGATCRMDWLQDPDEMSNSPSDPSITDWASFDYGPVIARFSDYHAALRSRDRRYWRISRDVEDEVIWSDEDT